MLVSDRKKVSAKFCSPCGLDEHNIEILHTLFIEPLILAKNIDLYQGIKVNGNCNGVSQFLSKKNDL